MDERQLKARASVVVFFLCCAVAVWSVPEAAALDEAQLEVHFFSVGQGDAVLVESPSGQQLLIDGGPGPTVLRELSQAMGWFDRELDYTLATHLDSDHIGGLIDVLARYDVRHILSTADKPTSEVGEAYERAVVAEGVTVTTLTRGQTIDLGAGVLVDVLWPITVSDTMDRNTSSAIVQVRYGTTEFLLTGDAPKAIEEYLVLTDGNRLQSEVLKVGHHGSRTSTAELFVDTVAPEYAVISAGADNRYGHPHVEVTDTLFNAGATILETATAGTVTFMSDGSQVWLK